MVASSVCRLRYGCPMPNGPWPNTQNTKHSTALHACKFHRPFSLFMLECGIAYGSAKYLHIMTWSLVRPVSGVTVIGPSANVPSSSASILISMPLCQDITLGSPIS